jgi:hypothetical protein
MLDEFLKLPQTEVKGKDKDDKEHQFKGVVLYEILKSAGVTLSAELRGKNLAKYVLIQAAEAIQLHLLWLNLIRSLPIRPC